nr:hypothetical protein [Pseudomonas sp. HS-2]
MAKRSVSYTQLEVYKRQVDHPALRIEHGAIPVSYTPLDVYKRQAWWSTLVPVTRTWRGSVTYTHLDVYT